jgi:hypothetical protein
MDENTDPFAGVGPSRSAAAAEPERPRIVGAKAEVDPFSGVGPVSPKVQERRAESAKPTPQRWQEPAAVKRPPTEPPPSTFEDIAKSAGSGVAMGVLADIPGFIGSAGQLYDIASQKLGEVGARGKEMFGYAPVGSADKAIQLARAESQKGKTKEELAGDVNRIFGIALPTAQGMEKSVRAVAPELSYAPQTRAGKLVASATRAVPTGVFGGGAGLLTRAGMAGTSGLLSEAAGQVAEGTEYETAARLAGSFLGPMGYNSVKNAATVLGGPGKGDTERLLLEAIARDVANGSSKMSPQQLKAAIDSGANPGLFNMGGVETRKLISKLGYRTPASQDALEDLNNRISQQAAGSNAAMKQHIASSLNLTDDAFDLQQSIRASNQGEINRLYKSLESDPSARVISSSGLNSLLQSDIVQDLAKNARRLSTNPYSRIVPPTDKQPGNIFFWDQIKRDMDDSINQAYRNGLTNQANDLKDLRKYMISELDSAAPNYKLARDSASESLGAQNAVEAGYMAVRGAPTTFKIGNALSAYRKYSPDRQDMFRQGLASHLAEIAEKDGADDILKVLNDPTKKKLIEEVLGSQALDSISGRATAESIMKRTRAYGAHMEDPNVQSQFVKAQVIYDAGPAILQAAKGNFGPLLNLMSTYAVTGTTGFFANKATQKQADQILRLIGTDRPEDLQKLGELIRKVPAAKGIIGNTLDAMRNVMVRGTIGTPVSQEVTAPETADREEKPSTIESLKERIASVESAGSGGYSAVGPSMMRTVRGQPFEDQALGKYQVLKSNIPDWTRKYVGRELTPEEFLADPAAQERVFEGAMGDALKRYGNERDAIAWWHSGSPLQEAQKRNATDVLGTRTEDYVNRVMQDSGLGSASGGRIERKSGGRVDNVERLVSQLMLKTKQAKRETTKATEPLLDQPDESIVKALDVAQQAI